MLELAALISLCRIKCSGNAPAQPSLPAEMPSTQIKSGHSKKQGFRRQDFVLSKAQASTPSAGGSCGPLARYALASRWLFLMFPIRNEHATKNQLHHGRSRMTTNKKAIDAYRRSTWQPFIVFGGCLLVFLCLVFYRSFLPGRALFSNDKPLGVVKPMAEHLITRFVGRWQDLNWVGGPAGAAYFE